MSRLPIRVRLTLPFAVAMASCWPRSAPSSTSASAATLLATVDQNLQRPGRRDECRMPSEDGSLLDLDVSDGPAVAQVRRADGAVVRSSPAGLAPLVATRLQDAAAIGRRAPDDHDLCRAPRQLARRSPSRCATATRPAMLVARRSLAARERGARPPPARVPARGAGRAAPRDRSPATSSRRRRCARSRRCGAGRRPSPRRAPDGGCRSRRARDEISRARRDAQRHARAARGGVRARAAIRRRREPRAAHAARAARAELELALRRPRSPSRARGRDALGRRGDRAAHRGSPTTCC